MRFILSERPRWFVGLALLACLPMAAPSFAQQDNEFTVTITTTETVDAAGNAHVDGVMNFNPPRGYDRVKRIYPNLYVLFRDFGPERSSYQIKPGTLKITPDDGQRSITFIADILGAAVSRRNRWQVTLSPNEQVSTQDANKVSTVAQPSGESATKLLGLTNYVLPAKAQNVQFDKESHLLSYELASPRPLSPLPQPQLDFDVLYKQRIMSAVYKVYGDSEARDGAYWVAKTILKNSGKSPIYDLKIYYRLGDFTDMSVPEAYSLVPPGGAVVDAFYPVIKSTVTEFKTTMPLQLYVKYEYKDAAGKSYSEELTKRVEMLGINQFEFSNLNDQDRTDSWFDYFNNAPLLSAFVTRLDDPVKQFAGYVSHAAGGAAAASDDNSAIRWLAAAYNMELANDIVYQTPSSFLTNDHSSGQDIKFPRDVFRDKSGTCVDLAITYAALAESVGLKANLMLVPGHAFPVIRLPGGEYYAVESTGLGGGDQRMTFEQAVELGRKELQKYFQDGLFYFVNVEDQWSNQRIPNPELQQLGTDFLEKSGIRAPGNLQAGSGGGARVSQAKGQGEANLGKPYLVVHDHGIGMLAAYCIGTLYVSQDMVTFVAEKSTDGRMDRFQIKKSDIREAKKNRVPLGQNQVRFEAFHIRMQNGVNFNFARIDSEGRGLSPDDVLVDLIE